MLEHIMPWLRTVKGAILPLAQVTWAWLGVSRKGYIRVLHEEIVQHTNVGSGINIGVWGAGGGWERRRFGMGGRWAVDATVGGQ